MEIKRWEVFVLTNLVWVGVAILVFGCWAWKDHCEFQQTLAEYQKRVEEAQAAEAERRWQMSAQHLRHDAAFETAKAVVALIAHLLREEEHKDAVLAVYEVIKAGLDDYEVKADRMQRRLAQPGRN